MLCVRTLLPQSVGKRHSDMARPMRPGVANATAAAGRTDSHILT